MCSAPRKNPRNASPTFHVKQDRPRFWPWRGWVLLAVVGLTSWGCGYTLIGSPSARLDERAVAIAVEPFANDPREPELEHHATAALRRALMQGHGFALTPATAASTRVQGRVRRFRATALAYDPNDNARVYRLEADVRVSVLRPGDAQPLLQHDVPARAEYRTSRRGDTREESVAREAALALLAQRFAERCAAWLTIALLER